MSKREHYGLLYSKVKTQTGEIVPVVRCLNLSSSNLILTLIGRFDNHDTKSFIDDLDRCISGRSNADEGFFSDSIDDRDILYQYPNVDLDGILIIPMADMKVLLEEWLEHINT